MTLYIYIAGFVCNLIYFNIVQKKLHDRMRNTLPNMPETLMKNTYILFAVLNSAFWFITVPVKIIKNLMK